MTGGHGLRAWRLGDAPAHGWFVVPEAAYARMTKAAARSANNARTPLLPFWRYQRRRTRTFFYFSIYRHTARAAVAPYGGDTTSSGRTAGQTRQRFEPNYFTATTLTGRLSTSPHTRYCVAGGRPVVAGGGGDLLALLQPRHLRLPLSPACAAAGTCHFRHTSWVKAFDGGMAMMRLPTC